MIKIPSLPVIRLLPMLLLGLGIARAAPIPAPPEVAASGYFLVDHHSGRVLAEANADSRLEPASLTKIMSVYVVFRELRDGNIKLTDPVLISEKAWRTGGSRMFVEVGKQVSVEDLLKGMIVQSGNDASVALAEHIAGSEETFANLMNTHAKRLGMTGSHFLNATGLPDENHYTTARDMAIVTSATIREFPEWYQWYAIKEYLYNGIKQHNRNKLLWRDASVDGVKTGHTESAGYCLVASAQRDDMRLISVMLGTKSVEVRAAETQSLLNYGFRFYETHRLYEKHQALARIRAWKGDPAEIPAGPADDIYVTIPRQQYKNLDARMELDPQVMAPVAEGQKLGRVVVTLGDDNVSEVPLVALEESAEGGIWRRVKDSVLLWFE